MQPYVIRKTLLPSLDMYLFAFRKEVRLSEANAQVLRGIGS